jgi:ABC-2 type transport system ATP-binding protein
LAPRLSVQDVFKSYPVTGGKRPVLRGVSFDLAPGEVACLVGPNGSGKTTLLKTLCGLLVPDAGKVFLEGEDARAKPRRTKRLLGFGSTEDHSFYGRLTSRMNLWFYAQLYGLTGAAFRAVLARLSDDLELAELLPKPFRELSNGQKQRMLLARALLHDPALVLLDEPHQNLDPTAALRLRGLLKDAWPSRGKTVLVSTHHLDEALRISDRWIVLFDGRVVFDGSFRAALAARPGLAPEALFQELTSRAVPV